MFRVVIVMWGALQLTVGIASAQEIVAALPSVWRDIEREAEVIAAASSGDVFDRRRLAWNAAKTIAPRYNRESISELWQSVSHLEQIPESPNRGGMWELSAYVVVSIADPDNRRGLRLTVEGSDDGYFGPYWSMLVTAAMDCFHDEESKTWLMKIGLADEQMSAIHEEFAHKSARLCSIQLLRGYEESQPLRREVEAAIEKLRLSPESNTRVMTRRSDALRAVLSSFDYASRLATPEERSRYRDFQSRLWRTWAVASRGAHEKDSEFIDVAQILLTQWRTGDEQFVLHIFDEPASTPEESKVAIYLAHKLPDTTKLKSIAESDSPQAPYAREALESIARQRNSEASKN